MLTGYLQKRQWEYFVESCYIFSETKKTCFPHVQIISATKFILYNFNLHNKTKLFIFIQVADESGRFSDTFLY